MGFSGIRQLPARPARGGAMLHQCASEVRKMAACLWRLPYGLSGHRRTATASCDCKLRARRWAGGWCQLRQLERRAVMVKCFG